MEVSYGVKVDGRLIYQSQDEDSSFHVAKKSGGIFMRVYCFEGDITTFDLSNKSEETMDEFFNRLVVINTHLMEQVKELRYEKIGLVLERSELQRKVKYESTSESENSRNH